MTDTKTGYWQDWQDALNENAKLRADNDSLVRECHQFAKHLEEARAELAALRKQAAPPDDAEIEAWHKSATHDPCKPPYAHVDNQPYAAGYWLAASEIDDALALMRRARTAPLDAGAEYEERAEAFYRETGHWPPGKDRPAAMGGHDEKAARDAWEEWNRKRRARTAPASGALREALLGLHAWLCGVNGGAEGSLACMLRDEAIKRINRILAAEPEAQEPERTRVVRNAEGGEDVYVFSHDSPQRFLMCQEEDGQFTVLFSDRAIGLSHVVELPPSDAALKPRTVAVPEDVRVLAEEFRHFDEMIPGSDECRASAGRNLALAILSLAAAPPAAPQPDSQRPRRGVVKIDRSEFSVANGVKLTADEALRLLGKDPFAHGVWCIDKRDGDYMLDGWNELSEFHEYFTSPKIINAGDGKTVTPQPAAPQDEEWQRHLERAREVYSDHDRSDANVTNALLLCIVELLTCKVKR